MYQFLKTKLNNSKVKEFLTSIKKQIRNEIGEKYVNYDLHTLMASLYNSNQGDNTEITNCIKLVELIHEAFYQKLKDVAVRIGKDLPNSKKFFQIPTTLREAKHDLSSSLAEQLNELVLNSTVSEDESIQSLLIKLRNNQAIPSDSSVTQIQTDLKKYLVSLRNDNQLNFLIENSISNYLKDSDAQMTEEVKTSLNKIAFAFETIDTNKIHFDLKKCDTHVSLSKAKLTYLNNERIYLTNEQKKTKVKLKLESYLKLKKCAMSIDLWKRYEIYQKKDLAKDLQEKLDEPRYFRVNGHVIKTRNFFINFDAHKLEDSIYNKLIDSFGIKCESIIKRLNQCGFFVPDELVATCRRLSTNLIDLNAENFEFLVFNTSVPWFVFIGSNGLSKEDSSLLFKL